MNRFEYTRAVILGFVLGTSSLSLVYMINVALDTQPKEPAKPQSNFEVVDHYKGCDLVRWSDHQLSEYKYVLHCPNK